MLSLTLILSAPAQQLVVHPAGDPSTGTKTTLPELLSALPPSAVGARWSTCAGGPTDRSVVAGALAEAEGAMRFLELEVASEALNRAAGAVGCLRENVDPTAASRIHYLRGFLAASRGDEGEARRSFQRALAFSPRRT